MRVYDAKYASSKGEMDDERKWSRQSSQDGGDILNAAGAATTDQGQPTPQMSSPSVSSFGMNSPPMRGSHRARASHEELNRLLRQEGFRGVVEDRPDDPEELVDILKQVGAQTFMTTRPSIT